MLQVFDSPEAFWRAHPFRSGPDAQVTQTVGRILTAVRREGDPALRRLSRELDHVAPEALRLPPEAPAQAAVALEPEVRELFLRFISRVRAFHEKQRPNAWLEQTADGGCVGLQVAPIQRVGVYVPGGRAAYPSTVIMAVVPARVAGVSEIALVSPPAEDGWPNPLVLAVAGLLEVGEVYALGGAQAIAALAYGTESVRAVDKIVGPGNAYVNEAKRQVYGTVGIDALAGPTEVAILADHTADAGYVAHDLAAQAEHDVDTRVTLITPDAALIQAVRARLRTLLEGNPRAAVLQAALSRQGAAVLVSDLEQGVAVANRLAPEHLQILTRQPEELRVQVRYAGAIFCGPHTPAVLGDYGAGPNHILPTGGTARFASALGVWDFLRYTSVLQLSKAAFADLAGDAVRFAELEGLPNHAQAIRCRDE